MNYPVVPYRRYDDFLGECPRCKRRVGPGHNCTQCPDCEEVFHTRAALEEHRMEDCAPSVYACAICGKNNPSRSAWRSHVKNMHQTRKDLKKNTK